ncbi:hypothetical protein AAP_02525 [Ascosphaera apis ARSEF 7405]|uniref:Geranylgeranyl pyrophosphate synthetase n=1 Tax=Ascosphaera apis ARSEF 7405 TaxID=392613 RepID=A0A167ZT17_9EURO|nr:hypothetical protein AAP_02525 [Ascosphaera apis ARSEF 7405]
MDGELIETLTYQTIPDSPLRDYTKEGRITNCKVIASYNWLQEDGTIGVPGSGPPLFPFFLLKIVILDLDAERDLLSRVIQTGIPPKWTPAVNAQKIPNDRGIYFRDLNAAKWPRFPIEPAVRSIIQCNPSFDKRSIDIVCCGSTLGTLLQFCANYESWSKPATMELEVIGDTLFITRREKYARETIRGVKGYGHNFLEAYTTWPEEAKGSISHQRIINYQFAGLNIALRYEVDAAFGDAGSEKSGVKESRPKEGSKTKSVTEDIVSLLGGMDMPYSARQAPSSNENHRESDSRALRIKSMGSSLDQGKQADIETRATYNEVNMTEFAPRLWLRQIPCLIVAKHEAGTFDPDNISVQDLKKVTSEWEDENQELTMKLARLLYWLIDVAEEWEGSKIRLEITSTGNLEIRKRGAMGPRSVLPDDLKKEWCS